MATIITESTIDDLAIAVEADLLAEGIAVGRYDIDALVEAHADYEAGDTWGVSVNLCRVYLDLHRYRR